MILITSAHTGKKSEASNESAPPKDMRRNPPPKNMEDSEDSEAAGDELDDKATSTARGAQQKKVPKKPEVLADNEGEEEDEVSDEEEKSDEGEQRSRTESETEEEEVEVVTDAVVLKRKDVETPRLIQKGKALVNTKIQKEQAKSTATINIVSSDDDQPMEKQNTKALTKRKEKAASEMPKVKTTSASTPAAKKSGAPAHRRNVSISTAMVGLTVKQEPVGLGDALTWPSNTDLVYPDPSSISKRVGLKAQSEEIQQIMRKSMDLLDIQLGLKCAFPEPIQRTAITTAAIIGAAKELRKPEFVKRMKANQQYAKDFSSVADNRISDFRTPVKDLADKIVVEEWKFGKSGVDTISLVQTLLKDCVYIFPPEKRQQKAYPFLNPPLINILAQSFFKGPTSFVNKNLDYFLCEEINQPIVPVSMLALVGAAVHLSISEWASGSLIKHKTFSNDTALGAYNRHIASLQETMEKDSFSFYQLMALIFSKAKDACMLPEESETIPINMEALADMFRN
ncbi:hypothetical protein BOTBODRAFT_26407 [Botryobasidium botryosum FD-172 SS1]|uniref:DUF6532 domain-containing protein n=1 Tax=Botryobasidium botryosum (strain FD-172 SS1) TaxID=930990 RepID=A0A067MXS8_BOTB1|nr:hypothetical protein BOTBODRAFT_26407 [Botryobasidium botryosum FD-172 SS1]